MMMLAMLTAYCAAAAEPPFSLGSKEQVAEIRARCSDSQDKRLSAEVDPQLEFFGEYLPEAVGQWRGFLLYKSEIVAEQLSFHTQEGEDVTQRPIVRSTVPWATGKWTKTPEGRLMRTSPDSSDYSRTLPFYTATHDGWVARLYESRVDGNLLVMKVGTRFDIDNSLTDFVEKLIEKSREAKKAQQAMKDFSLGSPERVAVIRATFDEKPLPAPLDARGSDFKLYTQGPRPGPESQRYTSGAVIRRYILLYRSQIVAEDLTFQAPGETPPTDRQTVRDMLPWASTWIESTLKKTFPRDPAHPAAGDGTLEVPLYTATQAGWEAKIYKSAYKGWTLARLLVVKQGVPGLTTDDLILGYAPKQVPKGTVPEKPGEKEAAKGKP